MKSKLALLHRPIFWIGLVTALAGCGGSSGGSSTPTSTTITGASFQISWPARTRSALTALTSAQSVLVVFPAATSTGTDIDMKVDRDTTKLGAYTGTYTLTDPIKSSTSTLSATFYALAAEQGAVVGTASAQVKWSGTSASLASIVMTGSIKKVAAIPATIAVGATAAQLEFTATDGTGNTVAVSPGSATWALPTASSVIKLTADGLATPLIAGTASVTATVDGITSPSATVTVAANASPTYAPLVVATTARTSGFSPSGSFVGYLKSFGNGVYGASLSATDSQLQALKVPTGSTVAVPQAVNDLGNIVGYYEVTSASGTASLPCYWSSPTATAAPLALPAGETSDIYPTVISKTGAIVAHTEFQYGFGTAVARIYLWPTPTSAPITLRPFNMTGNYVGMTFSDTGQLVVQGTDQGTLLYSAPYTAAPIALFGPDGASGMPISIGPSGIMYGTDNTLKGFYMLGPSYNKAVYLPGTDVIYGMNSLGQACGMSVPGGGNFSSALFWSSVTATPEEVPSGTSGSQAIMATAIYDNGTILTGDDYGNYSYVKRTPG